MSEPRTVEGPVGLGIIGAGALTQRVLRHLALPDARSKVRVEAVADPSEGRASETLAPYGSGRPCTSVHDLLSQPNIDAVMIASPIGLHYEHGLAAISSGRHVHFNKTMAVTVRQATTLIDHAASMGVHLVASPGEMLRPHNQMVRQLIKEGAIGRVCWAVCGAAFGNYHTTEPERQGNTPTTSVDPSWYYRLPGGGPLYDMTVYALHALTGVLGPVGRVTAMSAVRIPDRYLRGERIEVQAHDNSLLLLDFGEGLFALAYGTAAGQLTDSDELDASGRYYGTEGSIVGLLLNGKPFDYPGKALAIQAVDQGTRPNFGGNEWVLPHITEAHRDIAEQHVYEDLMQLIDWILEGKPSIATAEHARHVIEIIDAAYRSAETGQTQSLTTTPQGMIDQGE